MAQVGIDVEERECGWFERQRSQSIHGKHNNRQGMSVLRVTPRPPFIVFPRDFRVLNPWSGFSPFLGPLAPFTLISSPFRVIAPLLGF